jgi:hypothetical protein
MRGSGFEPGSEDSAATNHELVHGPVNLGLMAFHLVLRAAGFNQKDSPFCDKNRDDVDVGLSFPVEPKTELSACVSLARRDAPGVQKGVALVQAQLVFNRLRPKGELSVAALVVEVAHRDDEAARSGRSVVVARLFVEYDEIIGRPHLESRPTSGEEEEAGGQKEQSKRDPEGTP